MNRKACLIAAVIALVCAWTMVMPLSASAAVHTNAECALCHGPESIVGGANMEVGSVNKATACRKCHLDSLVGAHPFHYGGGNCGAVCHPGFGPSLAANVPTHLGTNGAFSGPESDSMDAGTLHAIHSTPRWMASKSFTSGKCGSCHATAACTACHNSNDPSISDTHLNHGDYGDVPTSTVITPWVGNLSVGVASSITEDTMLRDQSVKCGASNCHDIASIDDDAPKSMDTYTPDKLQAGFLPANIAVSGTWRYVSGSMYQLGRLHYSNYKDATFTFTFTGERVELIADKDPYRGIAAVSVDGGAETLVNLFNATTITQRRVWRSGELASGQHTIRVRVTGDKDPGARSNWVSVDGIKIHASANDSISPLCVSCHLAEADDDHGGEHPVTMTFSHDVTQTISPTRIETDFAAWDGVDGYACADCHTSNLRTDHRRSYSSGMVYLDGCCVCHPTTTLQDPTRSYETSYSTYRRSAIATIWTDTYVLTDACNYPTCHSGATVQPLAERTKHGQFVSKHTTSSAGESPACSACHPGDLRQVHNNPIPGNGKVEDNGCLTCHATNRLDLDKTCSKCHIGGYASVTTTGHAIKDSASHNASEAGKPFSSAYQGGRADLTDGGFECAACHTSQLVANHATPGTMSAVGCSTGGAGGKGCHMDSTLDSIRVAGSGWTTRRCSDCHSGTRSHDSTLTPHLVQANALKCAGTASGCHPSVDLWELHAESYAGGAPKYQNCANAGCHDSLAINKRPALINGFTDTCGSTSPNVGCHQSLAPDHATNFGHTFTATSYYNGATETGCTNQAGCHNTAGLTPASTETTNFGPAYHPNDTGCVSGRCHTSVDKSKFSPLPTECQECHAVAAYAGAAARALLTQAPASGGHYNDTTHTAVGMSNTINAGGTASATCANCHPGGLMSQHSTMTIAGSPYGGALTCGECHGDSRANGLAQVVANWTSNACSDCHTAGSTDPLSHATTSGAVAEVGSTCGSTGAGCHASTDLHALHKNAAGGCNLTGCHVYGIQSQRPTAKGCGGATSCHGGYTNTNHGPVVTANEALHTDTVMTDTISSGTAVAACSACHTGTLGAAHATSMTGWADVCAGCHNSTLGNSVSPNEVKTNWTSNDCLDCHAAGTGNPNKIGNWHSRYGTANHQGTTTQGCGTSGNACHNTLDLAVLHGVTRSDGCQLTGCHDAQNKAMGSAAKSCGSGGTCHNTYTATSHGATTGNESTHTALGLTSVLDATYNAGGANTCDVCHSAGLEAAHANSITGNLASPAWSAPMCDECHGGDVAPVTGAVSVIKTTKWPAKSCEECHGGANGPAKHAEYASGHAGTDGANTCVTATCHGNDYDLRALHNDQIAGGATAGCDSAGCHDAANKEMQSAQKACGSGTGGCHGTYTDDHASGSAHTFTTNSYYAPGTETGCTNQVGCHNETGSGVSNFADPYHPNSGCTEVGNGCHLPNSSYSEYTTRTPDPAGDCTSCHNSNYSGAADRVEINGTFPNGHYSEATHTAVNMTNSLNAGGSASATCNDCHSPTVGGAGNALANQHTQISIVGSPYGAALACGECHGDARVNGYAQVVGNWTTNACVDCHTVGNSYSPLDHASSVPAVNETLSTCGATGTNCHTSDELHGLHKNAAGGCALAACHDYSLQANVITDTSCDDTGACHGYTYDSHTHATDVTKHAPTTATQANATQFGVACGVCHDLRTSTYSLTLEHDLITSAKTLDATNNCTNCHNNAASTTAVGDNWSAKDTTGACAACHTGGLAIHADENIGAHSTEANDGCASTGIGCHNGVDLSRVGARDTVNTNIHAACDRCHAYNGAAGWTSAMIGTASNVKFATTKTCGQLSGCHTSASYNPVSGYHRIGRGDVVNGNDALHTDSSMATTIGTGPSAANNTCANCHSGGLTASHATTLTAWANVCTGCHNSTLAANVAPNQVKTGWSANECTDCHVAGASATKVANWHSKYNGTNHVGVPAGVDASGTPNSCDIACHPTMSSYDLSDIHSERPNGCTISGASGTCHSLDRPMGSVSARTCGVGGVCHTTYADGSHGFSETDHQTTNEDSWRNCGRCHLGYRADYTRTGTFNGDLMIDMQTPAGIDQLHRKPENGGVGCDTCHDPGSRVYALTEAAKASESVNGANCNYCHVDHRIEATDYTAYSTKSTNTNNLAKTLYLNFSDMDSSNIGLWMASAQNDTSATVVVKIGSPAVVTTSTTTKAQDPNRKKVFFRNIDVSSIDGTQPVEFYVYSGSSLVTAYAEHFEACASRGDMIVAHTANVAGFTCGFGDCHDPNTVAMHTPYEIPGAWLGTYTWPGTPTRENLAPVQTTSVNPTYAKVKSLTVKFDDVNLMRVSLNMGSTNKTSITGYYQIRVNGQVVASGSGSVNKTTTLNYDYTEGSLGYLDVSGRSGYLPVELWMASSTGAPVTNGTFRVYMSQKNYAAPTPTDACDLCHLSTVRLDGFGQVQSSDASLGPATPKLATFTPQCDSCHPAWADGHPEFGHVADSRANTCLNGCHEYYPAITGTNKGVLKYDLTAQHRWGDNSSGGGMSYVASAPVQTTNFGTVTTWPGTLERSNTTYVTLSTSAGDFVTGAAAKITPNTGTPTEYSFNTTWTTPAANLSAARQGAFTFKYRFNGSDANDYLAVDYTTTSTIGWTQLWKTSTDALTYTDSPVLGVPGKGQVVFRFRSKTNAAGEYATIDDVVISSGSRVMPGTMEGGCAFGPNGTCHNAGFANTGKCSDCHTAVNHHDVKHSLPTTAPVTAGFTYDQCIGVCHVRSLHWTHGVGLGETEPRPYRGVGDTTDQYMSCATCHDSGNATIKFTSNSSTNTPIASGTIRCSTCHTGSASMATTYHAGTPVYKRTGGILRGSNLAWEFNSARVAGHNVTGYGRAYTNDYRVVAGAAGAWYRADVNPSIGFAFTFDSGTSPGLLASTADGVALKNGSTSLGTSTVIHCADCHGEAAATLEGPQGAATSLSTYGDYATSWAAATSTTYSTTMCSRCHDFAPVIARGLHSLNAQHRLRCVTCHSSIPHAWKRPRLITFASKDPAPYVYDASLGGLNGFTVTTGTYDQSSEALKYKGGCDGRTGTVCTQDHGTPADAVSAP